MKISIIIPIYGVEEFIERCAHSLFSQTLKNDIEFIFVNDHTKDKSIQFLNNVLSQYPERKDQVKIIEHEYNKGLAAARLSGLSNAKGKYIIFCDSDDWVEKDMYEKLLNKAEREDADIVICDYFEEKDRNQVLKKQNLKSIKEDIIKQIFTNEIPSYLWNKLFKKSLFDKINPTFTIGINHWEDVSVIPRLIYNAEIIRKLELPLYHYNRNNINSYTKIQWKKITSNNIIHVLKQNKDYFDKLNIDDSELQIKGLSLVIMNDKSLTNREIKKIYKSLKPKTIFYSSFKSRKTRLIFKLMDLNLFFLITFIRDLNFPSFLYNSFNSNKFN